MIKTYLYDVEGRDREIALTADAVSSLAEHHILRIDATAPDETELDLLKTHFSLSGRRPRTTLRADPGRHRAWPRADAEFL